MQQNFLRRLCKFELNLIHHLKTCKFSTANLLYQQTATENESSINEAEFKKFQKLSQLWWKENGEFESLHRFNQVRVPWIRNVLMTHANDFLDRKIENDKLLIEPLSGLNILDVGCGGGLLTEPIARLGAHVTGIDMVRENIEIAQNHLDLYKNDKLNSKLIERIQYVNCPLEDLTLSEQNNEYFDAIIMSEVVEHVDNLEMFIKNAAKLLKNNGYIFITTLNRTYVSYIFGIFVAENILKLLPRGTHNWDKFVTPEEINSLLDKNNLSTKLVMGLFYNPFTKKWSWVDGKFINYGVYAQKSVQSMKEE